MSMGKFVSVVVAIGLALTLGACGGSARMQSYNIVVSLAEGMNPAGAVEVDLIGADATLRAQVEGTGDGYPSSATRDDIVNKKTLYLSTGARSGELAMDDALWGEGKSSTSSLALYTSSPARSTR